MQVRPFRLYGQGEFDTLQTVLDGILRDWITQWFGTDISFSSSVHSANEWARSPASDMQWQKAVLHQNQLWHASSSQLAKHLAQHHGWTGPSKVASPLWDRTVSEALNALPAHVMKYQDIDVHLLDFSSIPLETIRAQWQSEWEEHGFGFVLYQANVGAELLCLGLPVALVEKLISAKAEIGGRHTLNDRRACIDHALLGIEVVAGEAEVAIPDLVQLNVGQVIVLNTSAGAPLKIRSVKDGISMGKGYLAVNAGHKAVQLAGESV